MIKVLRALAIGTGVLLVMIAASFILSDFRFVYYGGVFGGVCLLLSWVFSGAMGTGDRVRANYINHTYGDDEDRSRRRKWAETLFLVGLPSIIGALVFTLWVE